jgi:two-component system sensor histidine kinase PrrB
LEELADQRLAAPAVLRVWQNGNLLLGVGADDLAGVPEAEAGFSTVVGETSRYRVYSDTIDPVLAIGRPVNVEVAVPFDQIDDAYQRLRLRLRRVVILGVVLFGLAGWLAATAALAPLARLRRTAERVAETSDLSTEVVAGRGPSEVRDLASSFETMLARLQQADLQRQEALEAARTFAAAAAHELRTPLTSIGANLEVLSSHRDLEDEDALVADLVIEHRRLVELLEALRLLSRGDLTSTEAFDEVDLADLASQVAVTSRRRFPDAEIELVVPSSPVAIQGWGEGLRLAVDNLVTNAVRHGVSADGVARLKLEVISDGSGPGVVVSDLGPGIPAGERQQVRERFVRGSGADSTGSGLGLALVAQQARIHNGSLTITDGPSGGAVITLRLS